MKGDDYWKGGAWPLARLIKWFKTISCTVCLLMTIVEGVIGVLLF